jgi:hypothetical protein
MLVAASAFRDRLFYITFAFFIPRGASGEAEADRGESAATNYVEYANIPENE